MNSKISTPLKSDRLIETDSDISTENQELKKILKQKQEEDLNLKIKMNGLEKEINKGKVQKKDVIMIENEKKIKELAEKISYISSENSDISKQYSLIGSSFLDSNLSNMEMDSNIESIVSLKENIDTDSNISSYMRK